MGLVALKTLLWLNTLGLVTVTCPLRDRSREPTGRHSHSGLGGFRFGVLGESGTSDASRKLGWSEERQRMARVQGRLLTPIAAFLGSTCAVEARTETRLGGRFWARKGVGGSRPSAGSGVGEPGEMGTAGQGRAARERRRFHKSGHR